MPPRPSIRMYFPHFISCLPHSCALFHFPLFPLALLCFSIPPLIWERDRGCRLNQLLKEQGGSLRDSGKSVGWSTHEALVYAQICFGRALQSDQSCIQQQRLYILLEALKVNIITSASMLLPLQLSLLHGNVCSSVNILKRRLWHPGLQKWRTNKIKFKKSY